MMRTQLVKLTRAVPRQTTRSFSVAAIRAAEGDLGSSVGGGVQGDSFKKREKANEDYYVRQKEMASLKKLKEALAAQRKHLDELEQHVVELSKESDDVHR